MQLTGNSKYAQDFYQANQDVLQRADGTALPGASLVHIIETDGQLDVFVKYGPDTSQPDYVEAGYVARALRDRLNIWSDREPEDKLYQKAKQLQGLKDSGWKCPDLAKAENTIVVEALYAYCAGYHQAFDFALDELMSLTIKESEARELLAGGIANIKAGIKAFEKDSPVEPGRISYAMKYHGPKGKREGRKRLAAATIWEKMT